MKISRVLSALAAAGGLFIANAATAAVISSSSDYIIPIDRDIPASLSRYPTGEPPSNVRDGGNNKYLNFGDNVTPIAAPDGERWTGFIITPAGLPSVVQSVRFRTANDDANRDPLTYTLYGTNDPITSADNSSGSLERWSLISANAAATGLVGMAANRNTDGPAQDVANATAYSSYRVIFPTVRNNVTNSMQIGEVEFYTGLGGTGTALLDPAAPLVRAIDWRTPASSSPDSNGENAPNILDNNVGTKYLNFGEDNSGFILALAAGLSKTNGFVISTANDAEERDPASYEIYGTLDVLSSYEHGRGNNENWQLISSGALALPSTRQTAGAPVNFATSDAYTAFKVIFPTVKNGAAANSMQISEFQLLGRAVPEPSAGMLTGIGLAALAFVRRRRVAR